MNEFSIQDLALLTGIKAHTLRIWEQRYGILTPQRTDTNIRKYSNDDLKKILNIALLNESGMKISHLSKMNEAEIETAIAGVQDTCSCPPNLMHGLLDAAMALDGTAFEILLNESIEKSGFLYTIETVVFPVLKKTGTLWTTNKLFAAQEHLLSNIIRQKLISKIDQLPMARGKSLDVLLYLPEFEFHELGLLYAHWLCKEKGLQSLSLGANLPLEDLVQACKKIEPGFVFTHLTAPGNQFNVEDYTAEFVKALPGQTLILTGSYCKKSDKLPKGAQILDSLENFKQFLKKVSPK